MQLHQAVSMCVSGPRLGRGSSLHAHNPAIGGSEACAGLPGALPTHTAKDDGGWWRGAPTRPARGGRLRVPAAHLSTPSCSNLRSSLTASRPCSLSTSSRGRAAPNTEALLAPAAAAGAAAERGARLSLGRSRGASSPPAGASARRQVRSWLMSRPGGGLASRLPSLRARDKRQVGDGGGRVRTASRSRPTTRPPGRRPEGQAL